MSQIPPAPVLTTGVTKIDPIKDELAAPDKTQILNALVRFALTKAFIHFRSGKKSNLINFFRI